MEITKTLTSGTYDVTLHGRFAFSDHQAFREILQHMAEPGVSRVVLHMAQVEFVDSAALGMLLLANDEAKKNQKTLVISGAVGQVKKMFDIARFDSLFTMAGGS